MTDSTQVSDSKNYDFNIKPWLGRFNGMPILLMTPGINIKRRYKSKFNIEKGHIPPLGVGLLGSILKMSGCKIKVLDMAVEKLTNAQLLEFIGEFRPKYIAVSCWSPSATEGFALADLIKPHYRDIPIVYGGPHITSFPESVLKNHPNVDIVAFGEGETTILEITEHFYSGKISFKNILGIGFRENRSVVFNPHRPRVNNLDDIPLVDRSLFKDGVYSPLPNNYKRLPTTSMVTSRGCPYKCTFCFQAGRFGLKFRQQSVERVIKEIKYLLNEFGIREINFWDDIFLINKKWVYALCDALERENINITWTCESRVDHVDAELLKRIAKAGCYCIFYGFESGSDELLNRIKKGTTVDQNYQAAKWTAEAGMSIRASFVLGLPGETPELGKKTVDFALSLPCLDSVQFSFATPYPGTQMYEELKKDDNFDEEKYIQDLYRYTIWEITYIPPGYKGQEHKLIELRKNAYRRFYFNPRFIWRHLKSIRSLSDICRYYNGLKLAIGISV